ncbi:MAG: hypothetical protein OER95_05755 [Acidimicrobiia bacterium]|nr:hypothetical protein [Acidimicrobiia bacterium]
MALSLADLAAEPDEHFALDHHPTWDDLFDLHRYLQIGLADLLADWDVEALGPLRLTKGRIRTTAICPAQVLAEVDPFSINFNMAVGIVCDAAAGVLALHPAFPQSNGWYRDLEASLRQEHNHLTGFVDGLSATDRADFDHVVDDLCGSLPELLGDLRPHRPTVHHRIAAIPDRAVVISGEVDIGVDTRFGRRLDDGVDRLPRPGRILAEVKSGAFNPRVTDELAHYGLIVSLQQLHQLHHLEQPQRDKPLGRPESGNPRTVVGCSITLGDLGVTPVALGAEILETAARRVLETTSGLVEINQTMETGGAPPTNPGDHCRWCRRVALCPDAPDLVLAELNASLRPLPAFDPKFDNSRFDGDEFTDEDDA